MVEKRNEINHIMRNGLTLIQMKARKQGQLVDDILKRCKEMEEALDEVEKEDEE